MHTLLPYPHILPITTNFNTTGKYPENEKNEYGRETKETTTTAKETETTTIKTTKQANKKQQHQQQQHLQRGKTLSEKKAVYLALIKHTWEQTFPPCLVTERKLHLYIQLVYQARRLRTDDVPKDFQANCRCNLRNHRLLTGSIDDYISVRNEEILKRSQFLRYRYTLHTSDDVPQTLRDLFNNSMYPWDTR